MKLQKKQQCFFKYDLNFLEYPLWCIDKRTDAILFNLPQQRGSFTIFSITGLPTQLDIMILYHLLCKAFNTSSFQTCEYRTTRYEIAKDIFSKKTARS